MWRTDDELVGTRVAIWTERGEEEFAIVLAVSDRTSNIKVKAEYDGEILIGNQWDQA